MKNPKVKICCVANADIAVKFLMLSQLVFLLKEGYDVYVVCSPGKWIKEIEAEGIKVKTIKIKRKVAPFYDLATLYRLWNYFRKEKFDVVFTFTPKPGLLGQLAAKMARTPVILNNIFGFYFHEGTPYFQRKFFVFIEKIAAKCSSIIFFRNKEDFYTAKKEKIGSDDLNRYVGDGIDILKFNYERFSGEFIKEKKDKLGIRLGVPVVGIVARLVREKGYMELFEAFEVVLKKFPEALLLVIGSEEPDKKDSFSIDIIKNYGIEKRVVFLGQRTDMDEIYSLMDIFVLPSHREGFSHSIMEASAMGKPIIASDIRGCRGAVENNTTGLLVPPKNWQKLADAIMYLLSNPEKARQMGVEGRKKSEKEFDERLVFDRIKKEYDKKNY